jgi:hypothetical protein
MICANSAKSYNHPPLFDQILASEILEACMPNDSNSDNPFTDIAKAIGSSIGSAANRASEVLRTATSVNLGKHQKFFQEKGAYKKGNRCKEEIERWEEGGKAYCNQREEIIHTTGGWEKGGCKRKTAR